MWSQVEIAHLAALENPDDAGTVGSLGMVLHAYDFHEDAEQCYRRACALDPDNARWHYYMAALFELDGRQEEALAALAGTLRFEPGYVPAQLSMASLLVALGRTNDALTLYRRILADDPKSTHAKCGLGKAFAVADDELNAATWLEKAVREDRQYGEAHYALAMVYRKLGHLAAAERHLTYYRNFKGLEPDISDPWMDEVRELDHSAQKLVTMAERLVMRGLTAEAASQYLAAARIEPANVAIHDSLIGVYWKLGDYDEAEKHYQAAIALTTKSAKTHFNHGLVMFSRQRYEEAVESFLRGIEINSRDSHAHHQLGLTYEKLAQNQAAERHYRLALRHTPTHRQVHFLLGRLLARRGEYTEAISHLEQTVNSPDNRTPWFLRALAGAHAQAGRPGRALELVRQAIGQAEKFRDAELLANLSSDEALYEKQVRGN